jgi:predicted nucleotidyltransferase
MADTIYDGVRDRVQLVIGCNATIILCMNDILGLTQVLLADNGTDQTRHWVGTPLTGRKTGEHGRRLCHDGKQPSYPKSVIMASMKSLAEIKRVLQARQAYLAEEYDVAIIGVFGSYARDEQTAVSDVDILIETGDLPGIDLFDLVRLQNYLTELLGVQADIAIKRNLRKRIGKRILEEVLPL